MSNNNNHIDNWLIESAALGNIPVDNAHWIAMQKLLEQKRKKRILFFWLLASIATLLLVVLVCCFTHQKTTATTQTISTTIKDNGNAKSANVDTHSIINNQKKIIETWVAPEYFFKAKNSYALNNNNTITAQYQYNNNTSTTPLHTQPKTVKKIDTINQANNTIAVQNIPANASSGIIAKTTIPTDNANAVTQLLNHIDAANNSSKKYTPEIVYMHNRYIDSLAQKTDSNKIVDTVKKAMLPTDTSANNSKKKNNKTALKSFAQVSVGYAAMNIGSSLQTGIVQLQYSFNIAKNIFIDVNAKAFAYNNDNKQKHTSIYRIRPLLGTTLTEVSIRETEYKIANGFVAEPGVGVHYKIKNIELGADLHYGMVLNGANNITKIVDTSNFYNSLPASIRLSGGSFDNNNFIAKRYSTLSLHCTYNLTSKWMVDAGYAYLHWYNALEGVVDDNKKRNSFYFTVGYRF